MPVNLYPIWHTILAFLCRSPNVVSLRPMLNVLAFAWDPVSWGLEMTENMAKCGQGATCGCPFRRGCGNGKNFGLIYSKTIFHLF